MGIENPRFLEIFRIFGCSEIFRIFGAGVVEEKTLFKSSNICSRNSVRGMILDQLNNRSTVISPAHIGKMHKKNISLCAIFFMIFVDLLYLFAIINLSDTEVKTDKHNFIRKRGKGFMKTLEMIIAEMLTKAEGKEVVFTHPSVDDFCITVVGLTYEYGYYFPVDAIGILNR